MPPAATKWPVYAAALLCLAIFNWSLAGFIGLSPDAEQWLLLGLATAVTGLLLDLYPRYLGILFALLLLSLPWWLRYHPDVPRWAGETLSSSWFLVRDGWLRQVQSIDVNAAWTLSLLGGALFAWALHRYAVRSPRPWIPLTVGMTWLTMQWILGFGAATVHLGWFLIMGFTLMALSKATQERSSAGFVASRPSGSSVHLGVSTLALVALLVASATLWPQMRPAWHWGELGRWVVQRVPALTHWSGAHGGWGGPLDLLSGTWGSSSQLGGPLALTGQPVLAIDFAQEPSWPVYLREAALTAYTGQGWNPPSRERERREYLANQRLPTLTSRGERLRYRVRNVKQGIWYLPVIYDAERLSLPVRVDEHKNVIAHDLVGTGQEFDAISRQPQVSASTLLGIEDMSYNPEVFAAYLQLPTLPQEVTDLVEQLTADVDHPYQQALIIEDHLRRHYPYRLDMPLVPSGEDFVAHFLFDVQSGYCSYHATAMAIMLRIAGIPSRWVQGFRVGEPPPGQDPRQILVDSDAAHAWVEAYFPGYGWVIFEPTPAMSLPDRDRPPAPATNDDLWLGEDDWDHPMGQIPDEFWEEGMGEEDPAWQTPGPVQRTPGGPYLGLFLAAVSAILIFTVWSMRRDARTQAHGISRAYQRALTLLKWAGLPLRRGETPMEYCRRVIASFPALRASWRQITQEYALATYGTGPEGSAYNWAAILHGLKHELGPWRYIRARLLTAWDIKSYRSQQGHEA